MELKEFLRAVFSSWVEIVGIILTILPFIEKIPSVKSRLRDKPFLDRFAPLLWIIGAVCIFWGFYAAWKEQREIAQTLQQKLEELTKPDLRSEIIQMVFSPSGERDQNSLITMVADIENHGAPSSAKMINVRLKLKSGHPTPNFDRSVDIASVIVTFMVTCRVLPRSTLDSRTIVTLPERPSGRVLGQCKSFRINTYKSVSKQTTLTFFRMNTYEKHRGGGSYC